MSSGPTSRYVLAVLLALAGTAAQAGIQAAVKAAEPQRPVILMTGWGHRLRAEDEIPQFVDRVLGKPPKLTELRMALLELTQRSLRVVDHSGSR